MIYNKLPIEYSYPWWSVLWRISRCRGLIRKRGKIIKAVRGIHLWASCVTNAARATKTKQRVALRTDTQTLPSSARVNRAKYKTHTVPSSIKWHDKERWGVFQLKHSYRLSSLWQDFSWQKNSDRRKSVKSVTRKGPLFTLTWLGFVCFVCSFVCLFLLFFKQFTSPGKPPVAIKKTCLDFLDFLGRVRVGFYCIYEVLWKWFVENFHF